MVDLVRRTGLSATAGLEGGLLGFAGALGSSAFLSAPSDFTGLGERVGGLGVTEGLLGGSVANFLSTGLAGAMGG